MFTYSVCWKDRRRAEMMDGKLPWVSNTINSSSEEIVIRYKSLVDIECGFRVLKSDLEISPYFHRLPDRIRAHASIFLMALIILQRQNNHKTHYHQNALWRKLRRIQQHRITLNEKTYWGISTLSDDQGELLNSLSVPRPTESRQF